MATMHFLGRVRLVEKQSDITPLQKDFLELAMEELYAVKKKNKTAEDELRDKIDQRKNRGNRH